MWFRETAGEHTKHTRTTHTDTTQSTQTIKDLRKRVQQGRPSFTLCPRLYTLTSGNKIITKYVGIDQYTSSRPSRYRPISQLEIAEEI